MYAFLNRFRRCERGVVAVEFALCVMVLLTIMLAILDLGYAMRQATLIEKGLRAGALYASMADQPLSAGDKTIVENLVKTATVDGTGSYLVDGWASGGTVTISETSYALTSADPSLSSTSLPVVEVSASVPFEPILAGLWDALGLSDITFNLSHEQAYVGL